MKPGDVVTSHFGKTIEIINTDAEGRLHPRAMRCPTRADSTPRASSTSPTLTGAIVVALGHTATGVFGTDEALIAEVRAAGERADERVWPLPLWDEYPRADQVGHRRREEQRRPAGREHHGRRGSCASSWTGSPGPISTSPARPTPIARTRAGSRDRPVSACGSSRSSCSRGRADPARMAGRTWLAAVAADHGPAGSRPPRRCTRRCLADSLRADSIRADSLRTDSLLNRQANQTERFLEATAAGSTSGSRPFRRSAPRDRVPMARASSSPATPWTGHGPDAGRPHRAGARCLPLANRLARCTRASRTTRRGARPRSSTTSTGCRTWRSASTACRSIRRSWR